MKKKVPTKKVVLHKSTQHKKKPENQEKTNVDKHNWDTGLLLVWLKGNCAFLVMTKDPPTGSTYGEKGGVW